MKTRLTRAQLAARLNKKPNTLAHWASDGIGPKYISINGRVHYDLDEVERWEAQHTHQSTAEYDHPGSVNAVAAAKAAAAARAGGTL